MIPRLRLALTLCLALTGNLYAEPFGTNFSDRFVPVAPCPMLKAAARTNGIPMDGIDPFVPDAALDPGDSFTALVTLFEKNAMRRTQWLLHLQVVTPNAKELAARQSPPLIMYSSTGNKLEFSSMQAYVTLRTLGPFAEVEGRRKPPKAKDESERFPLNKDFLSVGFDHTAEVVMRYVTNLPKGAFSFQDHPFSDEVIAKNKKLTESLPATAGDQRALAGLGPALMSYFEIVQETSQLKDILFELLDLPSLWSMVKQGGVRADFVLQSELTARANTAQWELPFTNAVYHVPMVLKLNKQPALRITFAATTPKPPLQSCAGVVGMLAERPGQKENYLTLRVLSARHSESNREPREISGSR